MEAELKRLTLEEVLDLLGVVDVAFPTNPFDLANLSRLGGSLNVLVDDLGVLAEVDDGTKVVIESLEGSVGLEELDKLEGSEEVRVFGRDLDHDLEVLADVDGEHLLQAGERLLDGEAAEVADEPVGGEEVGVDDDSLDVVEVLVVLESLAEKGRTVRVRKKPGDWSNLPSEGDQPSRRGWRSEVGHSRKTSRWRGWLRRPEGR